MKELVIHVPERGRTELKSAVWREIEAAPVFWGLIEKGVISVEHSSARSVRLIGSCFVGRAIVANNVIIEIHEKVEGALVSLVKYATRMSFKIERIPAPASKLGPLIGLLAVQFIESLRHYVSHGREFFYRREKRVASLVGGKLDVTNTIRLHARGLRHLIQFEKNTVAYNTPFNRIALATLREVDRLSRLIYVDPETVAHARALAMLFSDCRDISILFGDRGELVRLAQRLEEESKDHVRRDLLTLAMLLLSHESFEHNAEMVSMAPRAWFLNLETLFETAIRNTMANIAGNDVRISLGRDTSMPVFPKSLGREYRTNPDVVIKIGMSVVAIGDVKYKTMDDSPLASDIYQLIVHATAFKCNDAFLVYPGETFSCVELGASSAGPFVRVFAVDARNLAADLERLFSVIGVPTIEFVPLEVPV